jgi:small-conductance mechanosensitive channel
LWWEAAVLVLSFGLGLIARGWFRRTYHDAEPGRFTLVIPVVTSLGVFFGQSVLSISEKVPLLKLSLAVLLAWLFARLIGQLLTGTFPDSPLASWISRILRWVGWMVAVLVISDGMGMLTSYLDSIYLPIGKHRTSVQTLIEGTVGVVVTVLGALWLSRVLEARLLQSELIEMNLRLVLAKLLRGTLLAAGLLTALSVAGIDLTVLSVFGGALGVGLGLGLQKLAANYVSGFVILLERSLKVGDNVRVDGFEGQVTAIRTRYTLVQAPNGRESVVPNETLTSSRVENLSLANSRVALTTVVSVDYNADLAQVQGILREAAVASSRVLKEPGPNALLSNFGPDGLEFTVIFWIEDPEKGQLNVRSEVNMAILQGLRQAGIGIPYPQRVVHVQSLPPVAPATPV